METVLNVAALWQKQMITEVESCHKNLVWKGSAKSKRMSKTENQQASIQRMGVSTAEKKHSKKRV